MSYLRITPTVVNSNDLVVWPNGQSSKINDLTEQMFENNGLEYEVVPSQEPEPFYDFDRHQPLLKEDTRPVIDWCSSDLK